MNEVFNCKRCAKQFGRPPKEVNRGRTKFCTRYCSDLYKKERAQEYAAQVLSANRKQCKACNKMKNLKEFPTSKDSYTGYHSYCTLCRREINEAHDKKRWSEKRDILVRQRRNANYRRRFGMTVENYEIMLSKQGNKCAICSKSANIKTLTVDHDHYTGKVRGLLCDKGNWGLGMYKDDVTLLTNAIKYLLKS